MSAAKPTTVAPRWRDAKIGEIARAFAGGTPDRANPQYFGGPIPWVKSSEVAFATITETGEHLSELGLASSSARMVPPGSILVAMYGANAGDVAELAIEAATNQAVLAIVPDPEIVDARYLYQALLAKTRTLLRKVQGSGQPNLSREIIVSEALQFPSLDEQRRIAHALSAWDRAIETAEALVAAKRRRFEGARQRLIDDRQSHKGNDDGWRTIEFGALAEELGERNRGRMGAASVMGVLKAQGLVPMREHVMADELHRYLVVPPGAFAYNPMRLNIGSIAQSAHQGDVLVSPDYVVFRARNGEGSSAFIRHFIGSKRWRDTMDLAASGSVRLRIYFTGLAEMTLRAPSLKDQERIGEVLDALQSDISLAIKRLDSLRTQKRGLMQKLLTGEWRLPARASEAAA